jgi:hypothetical protein
VRPAWPATVASAAATLAAAAVLSSCSGSPRAAAPTTTATSTTTTPTTRPNYAIVNLPAVAGRPVVPPLPVTPGPVTVSGTVTDDTGAPVAAATVALERVVGDLTGQTQVTSAQDGTWTAQGILGGLYRIRAWRPPDLAQPVATVVFLSPTASSGPVGLHLDRYTGTSVRTAVSPNPPLLGEPVDLVVQVTSAAVGTDGVARSSPEAGAAVTITAAGQWAVDGNPEQTTSAAGQVSWQATCEALGAQAVSVTVNQGDPVGLAVPACAPLPTTTTTSTTTTTTTPTITK